MKHNQKIIHRRGSILVYSFYMMLLMLAIISLAVDYGHVQIVKTEEQRSADSIARGILEACLTRYQSSGYSSPTLMARSWAVPIAGLIAAKNPIDGATVTPAVVIGSWNSATKVFTADN